MAIVTTQSYAVTGNREHLLNLVVDVTPRNAYLFRNLKKDRAYTRRIDWQTRALTAAASNSVFEGAAISVASAAASTLVSNYTQLMEKTWGVSTSEDATNWAGDTGGKYIKKLMEEAWTELSRDTEFELVQGTSATGATATNKRKMSGFQEVISTNKSTATAARNWSRALHNALMETTFTNGGDPDLAYCKPAAKTDFGNFPADTGGGSGSVVRTQTAGSQILKDSFEVYQDNFGERKIVSNPFAIPTATASGGIFFIRTDMCSLFFLQYTQQKELAFTNHSTDYVVWHELTLHWGNEKGHAVGRQIDN